MGTDAARSHPQATRAGSVSRAANSQLSRRASSSHLHFRHPEHHRKTRQPERQGKLVLVFLLLIFVGFFVIIQHKADGSHPNAHRKDLQTRGQALSEQVASKQQAQQLGTDNTTTELHSAAQKFKEQQKHVISSASDSAALVHHSPPIPQIKSLNDPLSPDQASSHATTEKRLHSPLPAEEEDFRAAGLEKKRGQVKAAAAHSWRGYEQHAWGFDELQPITQDGKDSLGGFGATIVDSLDTLWLMGLKDEFGSAGQESGSARSWSATPAAASTCLRPTSGLWGASWALLS